VLSRSPVRVLLVNPNTNSVTTEMMRSIAAQNLAGHGVQVVGATAAAGPPMIVDPVALEQSAVHVRAAVLEHVSAAGASGIAAVVVGAIGDPGRRELEEELSVPVIGIGQASILAAGRGGRRFGMATSTPLLRGSLARLVVEHGLGDQFTGVRLTSSDPLVLAADPDRQCEEMAQAVARCARDDAAEAVVIAGGPLSETGRRLARTSSVEIVEPVPSACRLLRARLGLEG
jgi:allantoin racemase